MGNLLDNINADTKKTNENIMQGQRELNPVMNFINPESKPGLMQLYGSLAGLGSLGAINKFVPKDKQTAALLLANILQGSIGNLSGTKAPVRLSLYSHSW